MADECRMDSRPPIVVLYQRSFASQAANLIFIAPHGAKLDGRMWKLRLTYLTLVPLVIWTAFATRSGAPWIPVFVAEYGGDTLWAWMVFMVIRLIAPRWAIWKSAVLALTIAYLGEISQLYHAPWIDAVRSYRLGVVLLGNCFVWSDLVCYTVGILAGAFAEWGLRKAFAAERR